MVSALTCCGGNAFEWLADENSKEARIEEALIAMDDGNYAAARAILTALKAEYPNDTTVAQYLSNALAGLAGLDTLNLLETIDDLNDTGNTGGIDMVGLILGDDDRTLTTDEIDTKLSDLGLAIDALTDLGEENLTEDQKVQLGLLSLNHAALTIADIIADDTGKTGDDEIKLTEEGLKDLYPTGTPDLDDNMTQDDLDNLAEDVNNISDSIDAISTIVGGDSENDLSESFNDFLEDIDPDKDGVNADDLENYISGL